MNISHVDGQVNVFTTEVFTMTGISDLIFKSFPSDPNVSVIGISIPLLGIQCKESGIINPIEDLKEAAARISYSATTTRFKNFKVENEHKKAYETVPLGKSKK